MSTPDSPRLDVAYVARLARLDLTPDEVARLQGQLDHVLEHVRRLEAVDVTGVEPSAHAFDVHGALRADEPRPGLAHEEALRNAPAQADGQFLVPRILE